MATEKLGIGESVIDLLPPGGGAAGVGGRDEEQPNNINNKNNSNGRMIRLKGLAKPFEVFNQLYRQIHAKPYKRIGHSEKEINRRLMDDLDKLVDDDKLSKMVVAVEILVLLVLVGLLVATLTVPAIKNKRFLHLRIWQYIMLSISLFSGLSIIRFSTFIVSLPVLWWWRIDRYVVFYVHKIKRCVDVTLWFGSVLFIWYVWFRPRLKHVHGDLSVVLVKQVTRFLIALDLGAFLWFLKNVVYLKLEADLHYIQLFDRIRITVLYFHGLQTIEKSGQWKFLIENKRDHHQQQPVNKKTNKISKTSKQTKSLKRDDQLLVIHQHDSINNNDKLDGTNNDDDDHHRSFWMDVRAIKKETVPVWILMGLSNEYLYHMQQEKAMWGKPNAFKDDKKLLNAADSMLRKVILDTDRGTRDYILEKDLEKYGLSPDEKKALFSMFKEDSKGTTHQGPDDKSTTHDHERKITRNQFLIWAVKAFKNCSGLERTLCSSKEVFVKLNRLMSAFIVVVDVIIWLLLSSIVDSAQLALLFTPFVAASFIFGDSCKKMFEGLIFAFAMHPFDVGDRVIIDGNQMKVNRLNILTSVFFKYDCEEIVIYPNSVLTTMKIINLDITPDQGDCLEFTVHTAPLEDIQDLQFCIKKDLDDDPEYSPDSKVVKKEIVNGEIKMAVYFKYLVSYLSMETKAVHKSRILTKIMKFIDHMKLNHKKNNYSDSGYKPAIVEFSIPSTATLDQINTIKREIVLRFVGQDFKQCSKVVMTDLIGNTEIKMALYLRKRKSEGVQSVGNIDINDQLEVEDDQGEVEIEDEVDIEEALTIKPDQIKVEFTDIANKIIRGETLSPPTLWSKARDSLNKSGCSQG